MSARGKASRTARRIAAVDAIRAQISFMAELHIHQQQTNAACL
jgi:hypothetical protein